MSLKHLEGISPLDLHPLEPIEKTPIEDFPKRMEAARTAQAGWENVPFAERKAALMKAAKEVIAERESFLALMATEVGKLEVDALMSELIGPVDAVNNWSKMITRELEERAVSLNPLAFPKKSASIRYVPRGVIAVISPWNYSVANYFKNVFPALLTGNAVMVKPSEYSIRVGLKLFGILNKHLPPDLLTVIKGTRVEGTELLKCGVDSVIFTGSVRGGREVAKTCAELLIPISMELGGNDGAIVLADCNLDRTAAGVTHWALHNVGQSCGSVEVAFVDKKIADAFASKLASAFSRLKVGPTTALEPIVDLSPLTNLAQLELVEAHVADALKKGAKLLAGGKRSGLGYFYEPTLLDHCTPDMDVVKEETFGPVLPIVRVDGASEAIDIINGGDYGLTASIWTSDVARAERLSRTLNVGTVTINNHSLTGAMTELPWSGVKNTGYGVANSPISLNSFVRPQACLVDNNSSPELFWMPYDANLKQIGNMLSELMIMDVSLGDIKKATGAWKLPLLMQKRVKTIKQFFSK